MPVKVAQMTAKRIVAHPPPPPPHAVPPQACIPAAIASPAPRFRCVCASVCVGGANVRGGRAAHQAASGRRPAAASGGGRRYLIAAPAAREGDGSATLSIVCRKKREKVAGQDGA